MQAATSRGAGRGALAGAAAAVVWAGAEPFLARMLRSPYTDVRFLGRMVPSGRAWPAVGLAWHVANGAAFGAVFARLEGRGWRLGLLAAQAENALTLPLLPLVSRRHPDYRSVRWASPAGGRIVAQETLVHALFGLVLGGLTGAHRPPRPAREPTREEPDMTGHTPPSDSVPPQLEELAWAPLRNRALHVAARLDVAGHLEGGPRTSDELARDLGMHAGALYRLLRALESLGLFVETEPGRFALTTSGRHLLRDAPSRFRDRLLMSDEASWSSLGHLHHAIATGTSAFTHAHGISYFEYLGQHPEKAAAFNRAMTSMVERMAQDVVSAYDFAPFRSIVDVGGGQGALLAAILQANPHARGVLFDLPATAESAEARLAELGLADRCACVGGSFFDAVPDGEVLVLSAVLSDWTDEECVAILTSCRAAVRPGGRLLVLERHVRPDRPASPDAFLDLLMLVMGGGTGRSEAEYRSLLTNAGFELVRIVPTEAERSIFEAVPV